jgi:hypothetical protein
MVSLAKARKRRFYCLVIGVPLVAVTLLEVVIGYWLFVYQLESAPHSPRFFSKLAIKILGWIWSWPVGPFMVQHAPVLSRADRFDSANLYALFWASLCNTGFRWFRAPAASPGT